MERTLHYAHKLFSALDRVTLDSHPSSRPEISETEVETLLEVDRCSENLLKSSLNGLEVLGELLAHYAEFEGSLDKGLVQQAGHLVFHLAELADAVSDAQGLARYGLTERGLYPRQ